MSYKVPFYKPTFINSISKINSENFETIVENAVDRIEKRFKKLARREFSLSVNNPSTAIHLAFCSLDLKRGDKVICPINAYADIPEAIRQFDSEPIFTNIEKKSYHMDIDSFKELVDRNKSKKLRAVVVSHFAGLTQNIDEIIRVAKENKLIVIEDFSDNPIFDDSVEVKGDIALFSLNYKLDNTLKGAMLTFKGKKEFDRAKLVREHGLVEVNRDVSYLYDIVDIGCDFRLDSLNAYLLNELLVKRAELLKNKKEIVDIYFKELENLSHVELPIKSKEHKYSYFIIEIDKNRDAFARELKSMGIEVGLHYIPLNFTSYYKKKYDLKVFSYPSALEAYQKVLSIPCYGKMSKDDAMYVCRAIKEVDAKHIW